MTQTRAQNEFIMIGAITMNRKCVPNGRTFKKQCAAGSLGSKSSNKAMGAPRELKRNSRAGRLLPEAPRGTQACVVCSPSAVQFQLLCTATELSPPLNPSRVRLVEHFQSRSVPRRVLGTALSDLVFGHLKRDAFSQPPGKFYTVSEKLRVGMRACDSTQISSLRLFIYRRD